MVRDCIQTATQTQAAGGAFIRAGEVKWRGREKPKGELIRMMRIASRALIPAGGLWLIAGMAAFGQNAPYRAPRAPDGHADLNGIWQALNAAKLDLEGHFSPPATVCH